MRIGFYNDFQPCLLKEDGVVDISREVRSLAGGSPQLWMESIIRNFTALRPRLQRLAERGKVIPLSDVRLRAPLPRPGKILMGQANFMEGVPVEPPRPMGVFFKSPEAICGPGDTVVFPSFEPRIFHHEAELAFVIGKDAKNVPAAQAMDYVFGYVAGIDVSARSPVAGVGGGPPNPDMVAMVGAGPALPGNFGKSFDTFNPIGPAITTADEVRDPHKLSVKYRVNGQLRQDYNTSDMEHRIPELIEVMSAIMTLKVGDLFMCGTNHQGLGPLQDRDIGEIEIEGVGKFSNPVVDAKKRKWPQGVEKIMGQRVREMRLAAGRR
ncbi:MAG: fumarylacetoacetate hydrolase family protein [Chloroflexi bacterium]|nr:fumarylacetoacetate hydrolase family protein [Chloroflexota bacterium]